MCALLLCFTSILQLFSVARSMPVRVIVDAKDTSSSSSSPQKDIVYSPVFDQYQKKRKADRERVRAIRARSPERYKALNYKSYVKRITDPAKRARDAEYRKKYRDLHRDRVRELHKRYQKNLSLEIEEREGKKA